MTLHPAQVAALKTATRLLVTKLGGLEATASVCRVSVPRLSEYNSVNHPNSTMPLDIVAHLEGVLGEAPVTEALARLSGCAVTRAEPAAEASLGAAVGSVARQAGEATALFAEASADGRIDARERADLVRGVQAIMRGCEAMMAALGVARPLRAVGE